MAEQTITLNLDTRKFDRSLGLVKAALAGLAGSAVLRGIINVTSQFEDLEDTLNSVTGSAKTGAQAFKFLNSFATRTQFGVEDLTNSYIKLAGAGIQPTEKLLTTFTDTAAVTTDQLGTLQAMSDLFARTVSGGLGLEELNRLADRGVPVFAILERQLGLTRLEISEFGKTAEGARKITDALTVGLDEAFGGATASKLDNLSILQSNFVIQLRNTAYTLGKELSPALKDAIKDLTEFLAKNDELAAKLGAGIGDAIRVASDSIKFLADNFDLLRNAALSLIGVKVFSNLQTIIGKTAKATGNMSEKTNIAQRSFKNFAKFGLAAVVGPFKTLLSIITRFLNPYTAIAFATVSLLDHFVGLGKIVYVVRGLFSDFTELLGRMYGAIRQFVADALNPLIEAWNYVAGAVSDATVSLLEGAKTLGFDPGESKLVKRIKDLAAEYDALQLAQKQQREEQKKADSATPFAPDLAPTTTVKIGENEAQKQARERIEALEASLRTEVEVEQAAYQERLKTLQEFNNLYMKDAGRYNKLKEKVEQEHQRQITRIQQANYDNQLSKFKGGKFAEMDFAQFSEEQKLSFIKDTGMEALKALGQHSKKAFQIMKAAAMAEAIINTAQGVTKALAQGGIFGPILAGIIIAAGAAQIATIASQQYTGRQFGGPVTKDKPYMVGETGPEMFVPSGSGTIVPNKGLNNGGGTVNVNFNINAVDAAGVDQLLIQRKAMITGFIREATENQGNRSMV